MKTNKLKYVFLFIVAIVLISGCRPKPPEIPADYVSFSIKEPNFHDDDWSYFADRYNTMEMKHNVMENFYREFPLVFSDDKNRTPYVPFINSEYYHNYKNSGEIVYLKDFMTDLSYNKSTPARLYDFENEEFLSNGKRSNLVFTYYPNYPYKEVIGSTIEIKKDEKIFVVNNHSDDKYKADVKVIPPWLSFGSNYDFKNWINLVVMADGYDDTAIRYFEDYVKDAFSNAGSFHFTKRNPDGTKTRDHITNKFFEKYMNKISIIMVKTISEKNIGQYSIFPADPQILDVNYKEKGFGSSAAVRSAMYRNFEQIGLHPNMVDAVIIFVNTDEFESYSTPPNFRNGEQGNIGKRNGQPANTIIIKAPHGKYTTADDFHDYVQTDRIAHLLGHAMARLEDEYIDSNSFNYRENMRNIDRKNDSRDIKWYALGYDISNRTVTDKNHLIGNFPIGFGGNLDYVRPTNNSTMNAREPSTDYQFGPVNTYHMEGSFKTRLGLIPEQDPGYPIKPFPYEYNYYWEGYPDLFEWGFDDFFQN